MYDLYLKILVLVGLTSLVFAIGLYEFHNESDLFAGISLFSWALLAFAGFEVEVADSGITHSFASPVFQLFATGLALLSVLVLVGAATGRWPTQSRGQP